MSNKTKATAVEFPSARCSPEYIRVGWVDVPLVVDDRIRRDREMQDGLDAAAFSRCDGVAGAVAGIDPPLFPGSLPQQSPTRRIRPIPGPGRPDRLREAVLSDPRVHSLHHIHDL